MLTWQLFSVMPIGLLFAIVVMFAAMKALAKVCDPLAAPLAKVSEIAGRQEHIPYYHGLLALYAAYFFAGTVFAFTGGAFGMSADEWQPDRTQYHLVWGFSAGILMVALARIGALYVSTALARNIQLLTVASVGLVVFKSFQDPQLIKTVATQFVGTGERQYFLAFAFASPMVGLFTVEGCIFLCRNSPDANRVPYSLLRERVEEYTEVEQVFWPADVVPFTERILEDVIGREGLTELCWLTNTAPKGHMSRAVSALETWLGKNKPGNYDCSRAAQVVMQACARVIVTSDAGKTNLPTYVSRIQKISKPIRVRFLVINAKHAIVHLPIPFKETQDEQSNCAMLVSSPELVHLLREEFDAIWENQYLIDNTRSLVDLRLDQKEELVAIATIVYTHQPITVQELSAKLKTFLGVSISEAELPNKIEMLEKRDLVRFVNGRVVVPGRYARKCRCADVLRRLQV